MSSSDDDRSRQYSLTGHAVAVLAASEPVAHEDWRGYTFRQLDAAAGAVKGTAFRAFKRHRAALREGEDYLWLDGVAHPALREALLARGLLYPAVANITLISPDVSARLLSGRGFPGAGAGEGKA
ncbi:hypothetical protein [Alkalilimnicola sp. S0819]|uniref:hypothetical protein n=1 Tax=Alkalilimnicola sp. S0819 TaxID=2613922 RepID=UPI00126185FC|nr:hypothetical protein [Alkalilimnicola sp. S0819]KAB7624447.1 hypothetical protein F3N43_06490 [Alkalilimnicola sp. S0819]MPQ16281.1 hypothetical protein [Alkalilimnicola sp. S0819]